MAEVPTLRSLVTFFNAAICYLQLTIIINVLGECVSVQKTMLCDELASYAVVVMVFARDGECIFVRLSLYG